MSDTVNLSTFPSTKEEALTMLYLESRDLSTLTEVELVSKYNSAEKYITEAIKDQRRSKIKSRMD